MSDADRTRGPFHAIRGGKDDPPPPGGSLRRLASILAADISGYSRLMQVDEEGTHARVTRQRREIIEPSLAEHYGKLITYTGDGFLAMFDSPVEAVRCAIVIQQNMVGRNASLPRDHWILYRIGIHLGDVVVVGPSEVYGDGLNIAVRLEGIATPGEVYVSGGVYEQIKNKLVCAYQSLGDRQVKNITDPVSVYRVLPDPAALSHARKRRWPVALLGRFGSDQHRHPRRLILPAPTKAEPQSSANSRREVRTTRSKRQCAAAVARSGPPEPIEKPPVSAPAQGPQEAAKESTVPAAPAPVPIAAPLTPEMVFDPRRCILDGERRRPVRKANPPGRNQILCH